MRRFSSSEAFWFAGIVNAMMRKLRLITAAALSCAWFDGYNRFAQVTSTGKLIHTFRKAARHAAASVPGMGLN